MTIAVTAVSGHLGGAIVGALARDFAGETVVGLARSPGKAKDLNIEVRPGDYDDREQLTKSLAGIDTLVLVSGMAPPDERVEQHRNVLSAAGTAGVGKIVFTSIQGPETDTGFSPVVQSNRQTEADVRASGMVWAIGRNGIYIEPDIDAIESYVASGEIANCAGDGKCGYTTRAELAHAYACLATGPKHNGQTYNLHGNAISQQQLADYLNEALGTQLVYRPMTVAAYREDRIDDLGPFIGGVIAGIYDGIRIGAFDNASDFAAATGRDHMSWDTYFRTVGR